MIRNLVFDLDGTLTDPLEGIGGCIRHALDGLGRETPALDELTWCIGPPLRQSFGQLLDSDDGDEVEAAMVLYRQRFAAVGMYENRVYEGVRELLAGQRAEGRRLFVATTKPHVYAGPILDHFDLSHWFDRVSGSELDGRFSDKGELLASLVAGEALDPAQSVMIGDRRYDIEAARAVGLRSLAVTYGYGGSSELADAAPDAMCDTPMAIAGALSSL